MKRFLSIWILVLARVAFGADAKVSDLNSATSVNPQLDVVPFVEYGDKTMSSKGTTKKITAGTFIKGALGVVNVRAAGAVGDGSTDDTTPINLAMASGKCVLFPVGYTFLINGTVTVPDGVHVILAGTLSGTGNISCSGSVIWDGGGSFMMQQGSDARKLQVTTGSIDINGINFYGVDYNNPYCITIMDNGSGSTITRFRAVNCSAYKCSYFVIRQGAVGSASVVKSAIVANNFLTETRNSDAILFNTTPGTDGDIVITGNVINRVTSTLSSPAGCGIDVAGISPLPANMTATIHDVLIANNMLTGMAQGIHIEYINRVTVTGNHIYDINLTNSPSSGLLPYGIMDFGTWNATITGNYIEKIARDSEIGGGIGLAGGYPSGGESNVPRNTTINGNTLDDASIYVETQPMSVTDGWTAAYELTNPPIMTLEGNNVRNGTVYVKGRGTQSIRNNSISANLAKLALAGAYTTKALYLAPAPYFSSSYASVSRFLLTIENNNARDEYGNSSFGTTGDFDYGFQGNAKLIANGNNFDLGTTFNQSNPVNRTHYITGTNVPYGPEYIKGDVLISPASSVKFIITVGGTYCPASDTYQVYSTPTLGLIARGSSSIDWTTKHMVGQKITLTWGGGSKNAIVRRVFNDGVAPYGGLAMEIVDVSTGAVVDLTSASSGTITATNPLTAVAF